MQAAIKVRAGKSRVWLSCLLAASGTSCGLRSCLRTSVAQRWSPPFLAVYVDQTLKDAAEERRRTLFYHFNLLANFIILYTFNGSYMQAEIKAH